MTLFKETDYTTNAHILKMPIGFDLTIYKSKDTDYYWMSFCSERFNNLQDAKKYVCEYIKNKVAELINIAAQLEMEI